MIDGIGIPYPGAETPWVSTGPDSQVAEANLAKDLAEQMAVEFFENGCSGGSVRISRNVTTGCLEDALLRARMMLRHEDVETYVTSDPPLGSTCVRFRPKAR